ncbi:MAG: hypothetical protein WDZ35_09765 [Crocinitomicaceae bacterium]
MKKTGKIFSLLFALAVLVACKDKQELEEGWKPIYSEETDTKTVEVKKNEPLENPGRIFVYENYLLVNDQGKGIHIYDNTNSSNPSEISFIAIPGNFDFSVRADKIYADNIADLVIVDISNPETPTYINRIENIFQYQVFPDEFGAFECVDESKGAVIGWERAMLDNPKCFR